jgi:C-terminal processing protease CtpA/Prc
METSPNDPMVIFLDALEKADNDPDVKNLVIDLTVNLGGSSDVVVAMTSLIYGQSFYRALNVITDQRITWYYDVDRNFDGKFDEKDNDVHYDLNFCILTSPLSFSCGNLMPALCKEAGVLVAGQKSGGGSCGIGSYRTADGFFYRISSARGHLNDEHWQSIDGGITPNVIIGYDNQQTAVYQGREFLVYSYRNLYNLNSLSNIINEYYHY